MKKDTAIVTGASSGIGLEISKVLCRLGYEVFGIGRNFDKDKELTAESFHPILCNLLDTEKLCETIKEISSDHHMTILVNNAGTAYYGLHEELNPKKIQQMVRTNLEVPMILTCLLLRELKKNKGYVINISSVTAGSSNPHGCAYGATKAGLSSFSRSLFDEARKYGVKVVTISPDMTQTNLYRNANFKESDDIQSYLMPQEVAKAVEFVLSQRDGLVISDITLKPQIHRIGRK
ncbi:MAG: SDR family oxidoreductase [Lachnospiraceae bacterium]|jgi:short-subunit dehydrogenase|nr:SDR family oxidoreductase [Lachnospiraceae bacterium]MCI9335282.1 SDR family oxidoreductase [Lachnospiraceae bacterium]